MRFKVNITSVVGLLLGLIVLVGGMYTSTPSFKIFINLHAVILVLGGTLAATITSFPLTSLLKIIKILIQKVFGKTQNPHSDVLYEIVDLSKGLRNNPNHLQEQLNQIENLFLREAIQLQLDGGIPDEVIDQTLKKRAQTHFERYEDEASMFKTIARYPPAFGLLGAVLGMIALMHSLGSPESFKTIGPSMALALVSTLYGIALANFVLIPIGEKLSRLNREDRITRLMIIEGVKLLRARQHPIIIEECLKSHLLPSERRSNPSEQRAA